MSSETKKPDFLSRHIRESGGNIIVDFGEKNENYIYLGMVRAVLRIAGIKKEQMPILVSKDAESSPLVINNMTLEKFNEIMDTALPVIFAFLRYAHSLGVNLDRPKIEYSTHGKKEEIRLYLMGEPNSQEAQPLLLERLKKAGIATSNEAHPAFMRGATMGYAYIEFTQEGNKSILAGLKEIKEEVERLAPPADRSENKKQL